MNIEITENIIRGSIVYALKNAFGNSYKYYDEEIPQGFETPSFGVSRVDNIARKGYTGHEYKMTDNTYRYVIKYFTNEKYSKVKDINDKIDALKQIFKYLEIINILLIPFLNSFVIFNSSLVNLYGLAKQNSSVIASLFSQYLSTISLISNGLMPL